MWLMLQVAATWSTPVNTVAIATVLILVINQKFVSVFFQSKGVSKMAKVYFMHVRNVDSRDRISNFGGATIAYREVPGGVEFAESWCSDRDNFNKAYGRAKAQGRLNSSNYRRTFAGSFVEFRQAIAENRV
jgi:hypothetical protein